jgi:hypothetical protein
MRAAVRQFLVAAGAVVLSASAVSAQSMVKPFSFGISGGATMPTGEFGDVASTGYNVGGLLEVKAATTPLSFRIEGGYQSFNWQNDVDGNTNVISAIGNVAYRLPVGTMVRPYVIGGAGMYSLTSEIGSLKSDRENKLGVNGGAGIELPLSGLSTFIEARYHSVFTENQNLNIFPVSVGIRF